MTASASGTPLPQILGNTFVMLNGINAPLIFVSPTQINLLIPGAIGDGEALVQIFRTNGVLVARGALTVSRVAPGIFTLSGDGRGIPLGVTTYDGVSYQALTEADGKPRAIPAGTDDTPVHLVLYGTGFSYTSKPENVEVMIGGVRTKVNYAGRQPDYLGLDQMNLVIPPALRGRGEVEIEIRIDGNAANKVKVIIGN